MAVSLRKAFKNVLSDSDFLPKYAVLVVLSFCTGLYTFVMLAENSVWILPTMALAFASSVLAIGYDLKYIKDLIEDENAKLPEWSGVVDYLLYGLKYFGAVILFSMLIGVIFGIPLLIGVILAIIISNKASVLFMAIPLLFFLVAEFYVCIASMGFIYAFLDSDMDILALFNVKKIISYFSLNYFVALFAVGGLVFVNGFLGGVATISLKYALLYIIPLMLAPFLRMGINNLIAQAYRADKNDEKGSVPKMFGYFALSIIGLILVVAVVYLSKPVA